MEANDIKVLVKVKRIRCCEICEADATRQVTFLMHNARRNPASKAYGRDDCSHCADAELYACEEHVRQVERNAPDNMSVCSIFDCRAGKVYAHLIEYWKTDDRASEKATELYLAYVNGDALAVESRAPLHDADFGV